MHLDRRKFLSVVGGMGLSGCLHEPSVEELSQEELQMIAEELLEEAREEDTVGAHHTEVEYVDFYYFGDVDTKVEVLDGVGEVDRTYELFMEHVSHWEFELGRLMTMEVENVSARTLDPVRANSNERYRIDLEPDTELLAEFVNAQFDEDRYRDKVWLIEFPDDPVVDVSPGDMQDANVRLTIDANDREFVRIPPEGFKLNSESQNYRIQSTVGSIRKFY